MSKCSKCGGDLVGDGYSSVMHCEYAEESQYEFEPPDAGPFLCGFTEGEDLVEDSKVEVDEKFEAKKKDAESLIDSGAGWPIATVDEYVDAYWTDVDVSWFMFLHRLPAILQAKFRSKLNSVQCFCQYKGKKYRVTGGSRMGDIWLAADLTQDHGYNLRPMIGDCSEFEVIYVTPPKTEVKMADLHPELQLAVTMLKQLEAKKSPQEIMDYLESVDDYPFLADLISDWWLVLHWSACGNNDNSRKQLKFVKMRHEIYALKICSRYQFNFETILK